MSSKLGAALAAAAEEALQNENHPQFSPGRGCASFPSCLCSGRLTLALKMDLEDLPFPASSERRSWGCDLADLFSLGICTQLV